MPVYPEAANRWVAREHIDDSTCQPCLDNDGKLYKNREDAYADYPDGQGYINCVGAEFGNDCRGRVVKRRGGSAVTPEQITFINSLRARTEHFSARAFTTATGPTEGLRFEHETLASAGGVGGKADQLYIYDYIGGYDGVSAIDVVQALDGITGDLDVHINSGGGAIFEGAAIYSALDNYANGTVRTWADGVAASAASVILMAGQEITVEPAATVMVHAGSGGAFGTAADMRSLADVLDLLTESMAGIYAARTGGTTAEWLALLNSGDTWYSAEKAIEAKLATRMGGKAKPMMPEEPEPMDVLSAIGIAFTASAPVKPEVPAPLTPSEFFSADDVERYRAAMKGIFA